MSQLLEQIKADQLTARKAKQTVKSKLLTTLIGEVAPSGNGVVDNKAVLAKITQFVKNAKITQKVAPSDELTEEIAILTSYLPQEVAGSELEKFVKAIIEQKHATSMRDMGKVMGALKNAPYTIDMGVAQSLVKKFLIK